MIQLLDCHCRAGDFDQPVFRAAPIMDAIVRAASSLLALADDYLLAHHQQNTAAGT